jgi:protein TonB
MFEQTFVVGTARTRRAWTVPVSFAGQVGVVGLLVLVPFVFIERLPQARLMPLPLTAPPAYVPAPVPHGNVARVVGTWIEPANRPFVAPTSIPKHVRMVVDPVGPPVDPRPPCVAGCVVGGIPGVLPTLSMQRWIPPEPPVVRRDQVVNPTVQPRIERVTISRGVQEAKLITRVLPVYPLRAIATRTAGVVHLAAIISADGHIRELRVLSGHPWLVPAAIEAVRQWVYQPTTLNGAPVEVSTDITVTFRLTN